MIVKFTKDELRERESIEESYGKLLQELEHKIDSLREDPEPDEKKLAAIDKKRRAIKPPKKGRDADNEQAYFSSPEYQAYLDKLSKNEEEYHAVIKAWEDAGPEEWKKARAEYDRLVEELNTARQQFIERCENRQFNALGGDLGRIYRDAAQQALLLIENRFEYYSKKLDDKEYVAFAAVDVRLQDDGSFLLDTNETRKIIYRTIDRHLKALEADSTLYSNLKDYIEQILTRSARVSSEGVRGALIEQKTETVTKQSDEILAIKPNKYVTTQDRVSKKTFENKLINKEEVETLWAVNLDRAGKVRVRVAIDYNELLKSGEIAKIPELNARDYNVHDAIITLLCAGNRVMSYDMIYRAMTGNIDNKNTIPDDARAIIDDSLAKFKGRLMLEYTYKDEDGNDAVEEYNEPLVNYVQVRRKINGKLVYGAIELIGKDPPLLRWARRNGNEIDTRDISLLNVPRLNNSDEGIAVKMCLYRRLITMRNYFERVKKSRSELAINERTIRYDYVYEALGLKPEELTKDKRHDIKDKIDKCLRYWASRGDPITGYEHKKDKAAGNAYYAVTVSFMPQR